MKQVVRPMSETLAAIQYRSLDEAEQALKEAVGHVPQGLFDDDGAEPQGLLSVIPEDRLDEETFYKLFSLKRGVRVQVERIKYSGFGPPAEESAYMGFVGEQVAYVMKGCRLPVEIKNCPNGAVDIHHLEALVLDQLHPLNRADLAERLALPTDWDFEDLFELVVEGRRTAQEIDQLIHRAAPPQA
jgi:hypothetical protein